MKENKGFSLVEILIVVGIIGLILTLVVIALNSKQAVNRDIKRIGDIQSLRNALELVKNETGGYSAVYCDLTFVSLCGGKANSELLRFMPNLASLNDPQVLNVSCKNKTACESGNCNYSFTSLDDGNYEILFHLEKGLDDYSLPGCYHATQNGISKL